MKAVLVSHSHWDREWYRGFQQFRAHLVDLVDFVLDRCAADPGYCFLLDGQSIVIEDYLEIRPEREAELSAVVKSGRVSIGPWYVQPDSLLPSGEAHVRNLLLGRSVGERIGPVSRLGYTPDSFGHPAHFPALFCGFGISHFIYWRGHGDEYDTLPAEYRWRAPDGSEVLACHLAKGYFNAGTPPGCDLESAADRIAQLAKELATRSESGAVLLLNGIDHAFPEARTAELADAIASRTGFSVERGLLDDFAAALRETERPVFEGELVGGRIAPLLPGVWSTRTWIKLQNRECEAELERHAEPWAALSEALGGRSERASLDQAWKLLLQNQAHDSLCGCSRDSVHEQMRFRFEESRGLARETARRALEDLAGHALDRTHPWEDGADLAVWNPSPRPQSGVVRFGLDPHPYSVPALNPVDAIHPWILQDLAGWGFSVDGEPARLVPSPENGRVTLIPGRVAWDVEFVAVDVPAFGWKRVRLERSAEPIPDTTRDLQPGDEVHAEGIRVRLLEDGSFDLDLGNAAFRGLGELEDVGDRGDSYDFDEVPSGPVRVHALRAQYRSHPAGLHQIEIERDLQLPARLETDRETRSRETVTTLMRTTLCWARGVPRLDLAIRVEDPAKDHRLRVLFPVAAGEAPARAATTFGVAERGPGALDSSQWIHPAPSTFAHQGWIEAGGLTLVAPGLQEGEIVAREAGQAIAVTLLRCVGHLSRHDLRTRPGPAGPGTETPGAQCPEPLEARLSLFAGFDPAGAAAIESGLRAVPCGAAPRIAEGQSLLALAPGGLVLSALKPAQDGNGLVLRLQNPGREDAEARIELGFP
ncbi:MAG: hypothetical protein VCB42_07775, partial [Myxococcota bacterium]